jgi:hypothetical protein
VREGDEVFFNRVITRTIVVPFVLIICFSTFLFFFCSYSILHSIPSPCFFFLRNFIYGMGISLYILGVQLVYSILFGTTLYSCLLKKFLSPASLPIFFLLRSGCDGMLRRWSIRPIPTFGIPELLIQYGAKRGTSVRLEPNRVGPRRAVKNGTLFTSSKFLLEFPCRVGRVPHMPFIGSAMADTARENGKGQSSVAATTNFKDSWCQFASQGPYTPSCSVTYYKSYCIQTAERRPWVWIAANCRPQKSEPFHCQGSFLPLLAPCSVAA